MNIVAGNGIIHKPNTTGKYTICRSLIRAHWQPTDDPIDCPACLNGRRPRGEAPQTEPDIANMLAQLGCSVIDELLVIQVLPDVSGAVVTVRKAELQTWCEKRLEARKAFVNKCLRGGSGPPSLGLIRTTY